MRDMLVSNACKSTAVGSVFCETMGAADTPAAAPRLIAVINTGPKELIFHCPGFKSISPMGALYT